ncbi:hypothetical protein PI124_g16496 [Phytophthora idaei]|nr:hypothetical protein PI124_g16496 [Phytophthora idaei]
MTEGRRRNFTEEEDLALLRQALGGRPFLQPRVGILAKWDALAATTVADQNFPRESLSGKTASGRFDKLVEAHREHVAEDGLLSAVIDNELRKRVREEEASLAARRLAMETLSESSEGRPPKKRKETELKELLISLKEQEMADRKVTREAEALRREQERKEDREDAARGRQDASENMLKLVGAVTENILAIIRAQKSG